MSASSAGSQGLCRWIKPMELAGRTLPPISRKQCWRRCSPDDDGDANALERLEIDDAALELERETLCREGRRPGSAALDDRDCRVVGDLSDRIKRET